MKLKEIIPSLYSEFSIKRTNITDKSLANRIQTDVIVSFTSIPTRLHKLDIVVKSLMLQSYLPKKIVLWLHESLKEKLPKALTDLLEVKVEGAPLFAIHYSTLTCSHRKLIHSLERYPNSAILTCDDDSIYPKNWLELLFKEHTQYPDDIICNRCNFISYNSNGETRPYTQWEKKVPNGERSLRIMPAGYAGILYPPNSLKMDIINSELFLKLAPNADDLWFKAMSYLNNTYCRKASILSEKPKTIYGTQKFTLAKENIKLDKNKTQWDAIRSHYKFKTPD